MISISRTRLTRLALGGCLLLFSACEAGAPTEPTGGTPSGPPTPPPAPAPAASGVLVLMVEGLENGIPADIQVAGPAGFSRTVSSAAQLTGLAAGRYSVISREVSAAGETYTPVTPNQDVEVGSDGLPASVKVSYSVPGGALVTVSGLPGGTPANISVTPPTGPTISVAATRMINGGKSGRWRLSASPVASGGNTYRPTPSSYDVHASQRDTVRMPVTYALVTGSIAVAVTGLPSGASGSVSISGPGGFIQNVTGTVTLTDLEPGGYVINALPVSVGGIDFTPTPSRRIVTVSASLVAAAAPVDYEAEAGRIAISTSGLPAGVSPTFTITGNSTSLTLNGAGTSELLATGSYTVAAATLTNGVTTYTPSPASANVVVNAGATTTHAVAYTASVPAPVTAVVEVPVTGLPISGTANITVTSPTGATSAIHESSVFNTATAGRWQLTASPVVVAGSTYAPSPVSYDRTVLAGDTLSMPVAYSLATGAIAISVGGLPAGASGNVIVTGPGGYEHGVTGTTTLVNLQPGSYTVIAAPVTVGSVTYHASPTTRTLSVTATAVAAAAPVVYTGQAGNLSISATGLSASATPTFTLTGASGSRALSGTGTTDALQPGNYTLTAATLVISGTTFTPSPSSRSLTITVGGTTTAAFSYTASGTAGSLAITVSGLGAGVAADLLVTGPNSYSQTVAASGTLASLTPGTYTITARTVRSAQGSHGVTPVSRDVSVPPGGNASTSIAYALLPALVDVPVSGLPGGATASITVTPPVATAFAISVSTQVNPAATGRWRLAASNVFNGGNTYTPSPASYDQTLLAGDTLRFPVAYALSTGSIAVSVGGLPGASGGIITVTGPGAFSQSVTATTTLTNLAPGAYTVTASPVVVSGLTYTPSPATRAITVTASLVASAAPVTYTSQAGSLAITVNGLGAGVAGDLLVTGPSSYSQAVTGTTTLSGLVPGAYTIAVRNVRVATQGSFGATPTSRAVTVPAAGSVSNTVTYVALPSVVNVPVSGLPGGANAAITITSPSGATSSATGTSIISLGASGRWRLNAANVSSGGSTYAPSPASYDQTVLAGDTLNFPVAYGLATGSIAISLAGLPAGASGNVSVTGPGAYSQSVTGTTTLTNLTPGAYTVTAAAIVSGGTTYSPIPTTRAVTVTASLVAAAAPVTYAAAAPATGSLTISASGLAAGVTPTFTLTGTASQAITGTGTTSGLTPGNYTLTAATLTSGATTYTPTPASTAITITSSATSNASFSYAASGGGNVTNLSIENMYVTQAVQNWAGTAMIVVNREALVRVFVKAAAANTLQPSVRVRVYDGASLLQTFTIPAAAGSVPTTVSEGNLSASWNVVIPAGSVRANLQVLADIDPGNALGESDRTDNVWPANGSPAPIATATVPALTVRFVPVIMGALTGNVSSGNQGQFLTTARRVWPVNAVASSVRAPFTSNAASLQSNNGNNAWNVVLSELSLLQMTDGAPGNTHYYGVVKTSYGSGVAGIGYVPGRVALGWDGSISDVVFAHELGHNFGFSHAPCGVGGGGGYPYAGGVTGAWGWNSGSLIAPTATDIMGYCSNPWISDWSWNSAINYRSAAGMEAASVAAGDGLLIWGRVTDGRVVLEPAFRVHAPPTKRGVKSTHHVVISDATGGTLLDVPIEAERVDHDGGDERQFAMVVPWSEQLERAAVRIAVRDARMPFPSAIRVSPSGGTAASIDTTRAPAIPDPDASVQSAGPGRSRVTWDDTRYPMALVRDATTGEILSFLRKSGDGYVDQGRDVELVFSDGVRSSRPLNKPKR